MNEHSHFLYIIEEFAQAHVQNAPLEWFSSTRNPTRAAKRDVLSSTGCVSGEQHCDAR